MSTKKISSLDQLRSWTKDNGFIYPSSEIYGGMQAIYDYGHYGILLKKNIENAWWKFMIQEREDVVALDSAIFMHPKTWEASGHVASFADVLVEDKKTHIRYRADHLIEEFLAENPEIKEIKKSEIEAIADESVKTAISKSDMDKLTPEQMQFIISLFNIKSPAKNELAEPRNFNLLVKSNVGSTDSTFNDENAVYLRGETCQGIYLEFLNTFNTIRPKMPFGIAQIGKAFRNEIIARQFVFRTREFEQMGMRYFLHPDLMDSKYEEWKNARIQWHIDVLGIAAENLRFKKHEKLAHYASQAFDIEYNFGCLGGFKEIEGLHTRGSWDLGRHQEFSGQKMEIFDPVRNEKYLPNIFETSAGLNRLMMMVIEEGLVEEEIENAQGEKDTRTVLKIKKSLAPIKVAILPLSKKPELQALAKDIKKLIQSEFMTEYDETASIGKRYRRQDEIGTPFCVTIDFDSLEDKAVTVRDRDTMKQERIAISELKSYLAWKLAS